MKVHEKYKFSDIFQKQNSILNIASHPRDKSFSITKFDQYSPVSQFFLAHHMNTIEIQRVQLFTENPIWYY